MKTVQNDLDSRSLTCTEAVNHSEAVGHYSLIELHAKDDSDIVNVISFKCMHNLAPLIVCSHYPQVHLTAEYLCCLTITAVPVSEFFSSLRRFCLFQVFIWKFY